MGTAPPPCSFCARPSWFGPFDGIVVCETCPRRIGALADHAAVSPVANIWALTGPPARPEKADKPLPPPDVDAEELFRRFTEGVAATISPDDTQSHADLSQAYKEMGLNSDALREAAIALERGTNPEVIRAALRVVLTAPLLKPGGLKELKARLQR
jgi:hypothetical protein